MEGNTRRIHVHGVSHYSKLQYSTVIASSTNNGIVRRSSGVRVFLPHHWVGTVQHTTIKCTRAHPKQFPTRPQQDVQDTRSQGRQALLEKHDTMKKKGGVTSEG
ncbi:unnamed protein product [Ectocarpus sp. 12 AP-2014]